MPMMVWPIPVLSMALVFCFIRSDFAADPLLYCQKSITSGLGATATVAVDESGNDYVPASIAIEDATGKVVVSDLQETAISSRVARVRVFSTGGTFRWSFGWFGQTG